MTITEDHVFVVNQPQPGTGVNVPPTDNCTEDERPLGMPTVDYTKPPTANERKRPPRTMRQTVAMTANEEGEMPLGQPTLAFADTEPDCPDCPDAEDEQGGMVVNEGDEEQPLGMRTWEF